MNTTPDYCIKTLYIITVHKLKNQLLHLFIIPVLIGVQLPLVFSCEDMWPSPSQIQPYLFWRNTVLLAWYWKVKVFELRIKAKNKDASACVKKRCPVTCNSRLSSFLFVASDRTGLYQISNLASEQWNNQRFSVQ